MQTLAKEGITDAHSFRQWAKKHHPDKGGNVQFFQTINNLYEKLIKNAHSTQSTYTPPPPPPPKQSTYTPPPPPPQQSTYTPPPQQSTYTPPPQQSTYTPPPSVYECDCGMNVDRNDHSHYSSEYHLKNTKIFCEKCNCKVNSNDFTSHLRSKQHQSKCEHIQCECGGKYQSHTQKGHLKTKRHINFMNKK